MRLRNRDHMICKICMAFGSCLSFSAFISHESNLKKYTGFIIQKRDIHSLTHTKKKRQNVNVIRYVRYFFMLLFQLMCNIYDLFTKCFFFCPQSMWYAFVFNDMIDLREFSHLFTMITMCSSSFFSHFLSFLLNSFNFMYTCMRVTHFVYLLHQMFDIISSICCYNYSTSGNFQVPLRQYESDPVSRGATMVSKWFNVEKMFIFIKLIASFSLFDTKLRCKFTRDHI